jgi:hypothetical protein
MYLDSSPVTARRPSESSRRRGGCVKPHRQSAVATPGTERAQGVTAAARRTRLDDAIVSQWLLEQLPSDHRHALRSVSDRHELAA